MQAPTFYVEQNIPKVRWMYPGKCYYARLMTVPLKYDQALLYIYVLNDRYVIAFRDADMMDELGMMKLEQFLKTREIDRESPTYRSVFPISLTYGVLLDQVQSQKDISVVLQDEVPAPVEIKAEPIVKVVILPPEPAVQYEQMVLF